jgi:hypothetical protein
MMLHTLWRQVYRWGPLCSSLLARLHVYLGLCSQQLRPSCKVREPTGGCCRLMLGLLLPLLVYRLLRLELLQRAGSQQVDRQQPAYLCKNLRCWP